MWALAEALTGPYFVRSYFFESVEAEHDQNEKPHPVSLIVSEGSNVLFTFPREDVLELRRILHRETLSQRFFACRNLARESKWLLCRCALCVGTICEAEKEINFI